MLGIAIYSLLKHRAPSTYYVIYILDDGISESDREKIVSLQSPEECEIHFIPIGNLLKSNINVEIESWPRTTYARLFLPELIANENRVLYMDIDILVLADLSALIHTSEEEGIWAYVVFENQFEGHRKSSLGIPDEFPYFNAGVMLMELEQMRANGFISICLNFMECNRKNLLYHDQDILNGVMYNKVKGLDPRFNWWEGYTRKVFSIKKDIWGIWGNLGKRKAQEAASSPSILHFFAKPKPTIYNYRYFAGVYRRIWLESPWRTHQPSGAHRYRCMLMHLLYLPYDIYVRIYCWWLRSRKNSIQQPDFNEVSF